MNWRARQLLWKIINERIKRKEEYRKWIDVEQVTLREATSLHEQFETDTKTVKTEDSWDRLSKGDLKHKTESIGSCSNTNSIRKNIYHQVESDV